MRINGRLKFPSRETGTNSIPDLDNVFVEQVDSLPDFFSSEQGRLVYWRSPNQFWYNNAVEWVQLGAGTSTTLDDIVIDLGQQPASGDTLTIDLSLGRSFRLEITSDINDIIVDVPVDSDPNKAWEFDILFYQSTGYGTASLNLPYNNWYAIGDPPGQLQTGINRRTLFTAKTFFAGGYLYAMQPIEFKPA
jgi:hypothetical protein